MPPNAHRLAAPSDGPATLAASHPSAAPEPAEPAAPETAETAPSRPRDRAERRRGRLAWAIVAAALPTLMTALDSLVMTFALPDIRGDLDATVTQLQWFVNAYTLVLATLILPAAALGNLLGRRRVFLWGVALFTLASAGAALSSTSGALIAARVVQGAGGAAITTLSLTHLADAVPTRLRELAIGIWGGVNGLGVAAGPIIGGAVVEDLDWSFIFWINVPIGVVCVALGLRFLGESPRRPRSMDAPGILLGAGFVFPFTWALVEGPQRGWGDRLTIGCFGVSAASLILFLLHEGGAREPYMPLRLFRDRRFALVNAATALFSAGVFGTVFFISQYLQIGLGYGTLESGVRATPWTMLPMAVAPVAGVLSRRCGTRAVLAAGRGLPTLALVSFAFVVPNSTDYATFVVPMAVAGVGMGLSVAPLAAGALAGITRADRAVASGINSTVRQLGTATGIALCTAVFTAFGRYAPGQGFVDGLTPCLWVCAGILAAAGLCVLAMPKRTEPNA